MINKFMHIIPLIHWATPATPPVLPIDLLPEEIWYDFDFGLAGISTDPMTEDEVIEVLEDIKAEAEDEPIDYLSITRQIVAGL